MSSASCSVASKLRRFVLIRLACSRRRSRRPSNSAAVTAQTAAHRTATRTLTRPALRVLTLRWASATLDARIRAAAAAVADRDRANDARSAASVAAITAARPARDEFAQRGQRLRERRARRAYRARIVVQAHRVQRRGRDPGLRDRGLHDLRARRDLRRIERRLGRRQFRELRLQEDLEIREGRAQIQHLLERGIVTLHSADVGPSREHRAGTQHCEQREHDERGGAVGPHTPASRRTQRGISPTTPDHLTIPGAAASPSRARRAVSPRCGSAAMGQRSPPLRSASAPAAPASCTGNAPLPPETDRSTPGSRPKVDGARRAAPDRSTACPRWESNPHALASSGF